MHVVVRRYSSIRTTLIFKGEKEAGGGFSSAISFFVRPFQISVSAADQIENARCVRDRPTTYGKRGRGLQFARFVSARTSIRSRKHPLVRLSLAKIVHTQSVHAYTYLG